jgi:hypothetical protein
MINSKDWKQQYQSGRHQLKTRKQGKFASKIAPCLTTFKLLLLQCMLAQLSSIEITSCIQEKNPQNSHSLLYPKKFRFAYNQLPCASATTKFDLRPSNHLNFEGQTLQTISRKAELHCTNFVMQQIQLQ